MSTIKIETKGYSEIKKMMNNNKRKEQVNS